MGNFSVSHYARLDLTASACNLTYVLDLAEIPTFELQQQWKTLDAGPDQIKRKANAKAREWIANLELSYDGKPVAPRILRIWSEVYEGAGGMPILRVSSELELPVPPGTIRYVDHNYVNRPGWKEVVIAAGPGVTISKTSHTDRDLTGGLTVYPDDVGLAPPQDLEAFVTWTSPVPTVSSQTANRPRQPQSAKGPVVVPPSPAKPEAPESTPARPRDFFNPTTFSEWDGAERGLSFASSSPWRFGLLADCGRRSRCVRSRYDARSGTRAR